MSMIRRRAAFIVTSSMQCPPPKTLRACLPTASLITGLCRTSAQISVILSPTSELRSCPVRVFVLMLETVVTYERIYLLCVFALFLYYVVAILSCLLWWWGRASCPQMSVDILGTNCCQCRSMVQCCFMSTETVRLIRTESPGQPPGLSHSSWNLLSFVCLFALM